MSRRNGLLFAFLFLGIVLAPLAARSASISGIQEATFIQPMINFYISLSENGTPLSNPDGDPLWGIPFFNVTAFFDTGASGILLSYETANYLGVTKSYSGGNPVIYEDVGVGGSAEFNVSTPVYIAMAGVPVEDLDNLATYRSIYTQKLGPVRMQIATTPAPDAIFALDVVGIPAMTGKVVVIDPKPPADIWSFGGGQTYLYNPGTPYRPATADTDPGIPTTNTHVRLSYASFDSFTRITPAGAAGPTMASNPFIGPNPVAALYTGAPDNTPGVTVALNGLKATGSFLFDTGASASMISTAIAAKLHVRYAGGRNSGVLEFFDPDRPGWTGTVPNQFSLDLTGVGGDVSATGFYLDSMLIRTLEGDASNDADPNHLVFHGMPVLVNDITVQNPLTQQTLTLDGVFGMNSLFGDLFDASSGNFNWIVFDQPNGILGLDVKASTVSWTGGGNGSTLWSNASNWKGQTAPAEGFGLIFGETSPTSVNNFNNFAAGTKFSGITFDGGSAFDLKGNSIQLAGDVVNISTQTQTISLNVVLADATSTFLADSADIVVKGHIDGPQGLVKTGASKLILKNSNSYTGDTTVVEGTLTLDGGDLFDGSTVDLASGTTLEVLSGSPTLGNIIGQGTVSVTGTNSVLTAQSITADSLVIGGNPEASVVPEPSMIVLCALAALITVGYWRKLAR